MPASRDPGAAYPHLSKEQIELLITVLSTTRGTHHDGHQASLAEGTLAYLLSFYTRRWGLPPALAARLPQPGAGTG